jgi:hypothetical protein
MNYANDLRPFTRMDVDSALIGCPETELSQHAYGTDLISVSTFGIRNDF